jgi:hypothetical protein
MDFKSKDNMQTLKKNSMIAYRTCFSSVSHHGYKLDVLKSGMQKYLRRKKLPEMIWCALEIFKFELWSESDTEKKMAKGIITNMLNRIIVMMDEELLFIEVERYLVLRKLIENFDNDRKNGMKWLVYICHCLQDGKLSRHASDIRAYWDYRFRLDPENAGNQKKYDKERLDEYGEKIDDYHYEKFLDCFKKNDDGMHFWLFKIFNGGRKSKKYVFRKKKENINKIWKMLFDLEFVHYQKYNKGLVKKLLEYKFDEFNKNKTRGERFMFLVNCIELVRGGPCRFFINELYYNDLKEMYSGKKDEGNALSVYWTKSCEYMQMDDYVVDMHTSQGRKAGKNRKDFALEGCVVVDENVEFLKKEWREYYILEKTLNPVRSKKKKEKKKKEKDETKNMSVKEMENEIKKIKEENVKIKEENDKLKKDIKFYFKKSENIKKEIIKVEAKTEKSREEIRKEKYKRIKKMRGKPDFDDLEKDLEFIDSKIIDVNKIKLCSDITCGNKVMCFEYEGKIWKEGRVSMNYNRDYCVLDECKNLFGLEKIEMKRVVANFRIEKKDRTKKSWKDNWKMVSWGPCVGDNKDVKNKVVYCVMDKIEPGTEIGKNKKLLKDRKMLKEYVKIGVFRGIFRVSDFNGRNVLVKHGNKLVSIDEGDIGKRVDILGKREKWLIEALNQDKSIIKEILEEINKAWNEEYDCLVWSIMADYNFSKELIHEVTNNFKNLRKDLESEGVEFD